MNVPNPLDIFWGLKSKILFSVIAVLLKHWQPESLISEIKFILNIRDINLSHPPVNSFSNNIRLVELPPLINAEEKVELSKHVLHIKLDGRPDVFHGRAACE